METNAYQKVFYILLPILLFSILRISEGMFVSAKEKKTPFDYNINPCIPCNGSIYQTIRSQNTFNVSDNLQDVPMECFKGIIKSPMMNYYNNELDLAVSIIKPNDKI